MAVFSDGLNRASQSDLHTVARPVPYKCKRKRRRLSTGCHFDVTFGGISGPVSSGSPEPGAGFYAGFCVGFTAAQRRLSCVSSGKKRRFNMLIRYIRKAG